jgi:hypothetical protein
MPLVCLVAAALAGTALVAKTPEELNESDWTQIRAEYERHRHSAVADGSGYRARNPRQQWLVRFDSQGFLVEPDKGDWRWGLELVGVTGKARVTADKGRVTYAWSADLEEWFVNDSRGLEHGFTVRQRDPGSERLELRLGVRGGLWPRASSDGSAVAFLDDSAAAVVNYAGLKAWDADGHVLPARMETFGKEVRLLVDDRGARYPVTIDPIAQQAYLKASNTRPGDQHFGVAVAVSGDTAVVGAHQEEAAYVFTRSAGVWSQQAHLKASNPWFGDEFGRSVAVSGETIVVGAYRESSSATGVNGNQSNNDAPWSGAAYVFTRSAGVWSQQAYVKASNTEWSDLFGYSVAVSGDTLVVGAVGEDSRAIGVNGNQYDDDGRNAHYLYGFTGAAYVFTRSAGVWSQQAYLKASNDRTDFFFGSSVAVSGDTVVVGEGMAKAAYVFTRSAGVWSQQPDLKGSNTEANFGPSVAVSGDTIVVGGFGANVFVQSHGVWSRQAYLNAKPGSQFGGSVAVSGDMVVVGAHADSSNATGVNGDQNNNSMAESGAAYVFTRSAGIWSQQAYLKASNPETFDLFGSSVAVSGDTIVVGAFLEDSNSIGVNGDQSNNNAPESGAAYVFTVPLYAAPEVTPQLTITETGVVYNRATGRFSRSVTIINRGTALNAAAYVLDSLPAGVSLFNANGNTGATAPPGRPYREIGAIGAGATISFTLEFTRTGTPAIAYTKRVLGDGLR